MNDQLDKNQNTQPIPRVSNDMHLEETQVLDKKGVRELPPLPREKIAGEEQRQGSPLSKKKNSKRKRRLLLAGGFLLALFCGFMISGYYHDQQQMAENDKAYQTHQLQQQKQELEKEKKDLETKRRELQARSDRLNGRNEQMSADDSSASTVSRLWNKVTGKSAERQQEARSNTDKSSKAASAAGTVSQSIDEAQAALDDVNSKLDNLNEVRQQASKVKDAAASAYSEHADVVDKALYYASQGVNMMKSLLSH